MKYDDFSSIVQLGVGLNVGTALLQLYGEIGMQPMVRVLSRIKQLVEEEPRVRSRCEDRLGNLEGQFEVFRIKLFNELRALIKIATAIAISLTVILLIISFKADDIIPDGWAIVFSALAVLPPPAILATLWVNASKILSPLKDEADLLEKEALAASSG